MWTCVKSYVNLCEKLCEPVWKAMWTCELVWSCESVWVSAVVMWISAPMTECCNDNVNDSPPSHTSQYHLSGRCSSQELSPHILHYSKYSPSRLLPFGVCCCAASGDDSHGLGLGGRASDADKRIVWTPSGIWSRGTYIRVSSDRRWVIHRLLCIKRVSHSQNNVI